MHKPRVETELVVTSGSQDGLSKAIEMLMEEGDPVSWLVGYKMHLVIYYRWFLQLI